MSIYSPKRAEISHILSIDFGEAKVGLAMADTETKIAFAYTTLKNDKNFLANLLAIMEKENIKTVIIGAPKFSNLKSKSNLEKRKEYQKLGSLIEKNRPKIQVFFVDEMFSTKMAQINLKEKGTKKIKRFDDQEASRIILQSWLDKS